MSKTEDSAEYPAGTPAGSGTRLVGAGRRPEWTGTGDQPGAVVSPPVWRASTHLYPNMTALRAGTSANADGRFYYGRRGAPTQWALAEALAASSAEILAANAIDVHVGPEGPGAQPREVVPDDDAIRSCVLIGYITVMKGDRAWWTLCHSARFMNLIQSRCI